MTAEPLTEAELANVREEIRYMNDLRHGPWDRVEATYRVAHEAPRLLATLDAERDKPCAHCEHREAHDD